MRVNGELILAVTTAIEPVTATIHAIVSEDIHDDCLISRADLELLERIPQGFPNARVPRLRPIFRQTKVLKMEKTIKCRSVQDSTVDRIHQDYKDIMSDELNPVPMQTGKKMHINMTENSRPFKTLIARSCLLYTSPSPRDLSTSRMPSSA